MQFGYSTHEGMVLFTPLDDLSVLKAYLGEEAFRTFDVGIMVGHLSHIRRKKHGVC